MKSLGWLTGCALALACAHEGKSVVRESDTKMQGTGAGEASQPQADSMAYASNQKESRQESATAGAAIRPFNVEVPESALIDLRQRIAATRWPDRETVPDRSQGVQLEKGGHFAAWEQPELFAAEMRAAFKPLRPADAKVAGR